MAKLILLSLFFWVPPYLHTIANCCALGNQQYTFAYVALIIEVDVVCQTARAQGLQLQAFLSRPNGLDRERGNNMIISLSHIVAIYA